VSVYQVKERPTKVSFECFVILGVVPYYMSGSSSLGALAVVCRLLVNNLVFVPTLSERSVSAFEFIYSFLRAILFLRDLSIFLNEFRFIDIQL